MAIDITVPELGESITEVQIAQWQRKQGESIDKDDTIVTIDSDKATVEVPAPASGTLVKIIKGDGEEAAVGDVIGRLEPGNGAKESSGSKDAATSADRPVSGEESGKRPKEKKAQKRRGRAGKEAGRDTKAKSGGGGRKTESDSDQGRRSAEPQDPKSPRIMPAAQWLLEEHDLDADEIKATGPGGRLLKEDVLAFLETRASAGESARADNVPSDGPAKDTAETARTPASRTPGPILDDQRAEEVLPMTPLRRTVAKRLVEAQQTMAILTTFNEIDMSAVMALRREQQEPFQAKHGVKLGFMSFFVKAVVGAFQEVPRLNACVRDDKIVLFRYCDIGVAIGAGKGLVVPPLRDAQQMSFAQIEQAIADLAQRARENKLTPQELTGGTFTITNGGIYGSMLSTPIINPPQCGILGLHAIQDRPVARDGQIVIRPMMYAALSYDHRIVDGREAVTFLRRVKELVENPARMLLNA